MKATCQGSLVLLVLLLAAQVAAQPTMDQLWPNTDGLRWEFEYHWADARSGLSMTSPAYLQLSGTHETAGGTAQNLSAGHADLPLPPALAGATPPMGGLLGYIWKARPELRAEIERRCARAGKNSTETWQPFLLHDGYFMKTATAIEMWQDARDHSTWTYLQNDITVGATFTHQLIPEITPDVFLHGTIASIGATVVTPFAVYDDAVRVDYLIDLGQGILIDENGTEIGTSHGEIRGHVHYVANVGPVEMYEQLFPYVTIDCGGVDCPPGEWIDWLGLAVTTQSLAATDAPVPNEAVSWGEVKTLFR